MQDSDLISIGELASRTGISVDTIRVWERRYGQPVAVRLPSGHRRYCQEDVRRLRRVAETLALGHRPSTVLKLSDQQVDAILSTQTPNLADDRRIEHRLARVRQYDRAGLLDEFRGILARDGVRPLVLDHLMPLAAAIGRAWADGSIHVRHEHFASELVMDLMREARGRIATPEQGPVCLLASLTGEQHAIGVQAASLFTCLAGGRPRILGTNMPNEEIAVAVVENKARVVALSISLATGGVATDRTLADLRQRLDDDVDILVGGAGARGARRGPKGLRYFTSFLDYESFVRKLNVTTQHGFA